MSDVDEEEMFGRDDPEEGMIDLDQDAETLKNRIIGVARTGMAKTADVDDWDALWKDMPLEADATGKRKRQALYDFCKLGLAFYYEFL